MKLLFSTTSKDRGDAFDCEAIRRQLESRTYPREELSQILVDYNRDLGNDSLALAQAKKLSKGTSVCVVTGQQLGLMGGPIYTFLKAITCLLAARDLGAIPIFWAATEDHDVAEINHAVQLAPKGDLHTFRLQFERQDISVEDLQLTEDHHQVIASFWRSLGMETSPEAQVTSGNKSYSQAMMRLLVHVFRGTGLVFLEPRLLRNHQSTVLIREITEEKRLKEALETGTVRSSPPPLTALTPPNIFFKTNDRTRERITRAPRGFKVKGKTWSSAELEQRISQTPERFSPNVALRPVVQCHLLPTLAYVGGPSELSYHKQLSEYFHAHDIVIPKLIPRTQATFIPTEAQNYLKAFPLNPWDKLPKSWHTLTPSFDAERGRIIEKLHSLVQEEMGTALIETQQKNLIEQFTFTLRQTAQGNTLSKLGLPKHSLHFLKNLITPRGRPQERVLNFWAVTNQVPNLTRHLLQSLDWREQRHHYIYL